MSKIPYALSVGLTPTKNATILSVYSTPEPRTALPYLAPYLAESGSTPSHSVLLLLVVNALSTNEATSYQCSFPDSIVSTILSDVKGPTSRI